MNEQKTILHLTNEKEEQILLRRILDQAALCEQRSMLTHTPFLSPRIQTLCRPLLKQGEPSLFFGGYPDAERQMLFFLPDYITAEALLADTEELPIRALKTELPKDRTLTHRDFLGALLGMGISRNSLGDILLTEKEAILLIQKDMEPFVQSSMEQAGRGQIRWQPLSLSLIQKPEQSYREITDTVSSLRLDAVCALGFSISRTKAADYIAAGRTLQNGALIQKPDRPVQAGDVLSLRGFGKLKVAEIGGQSRKGRTFLRLLRFL